ncbi:MAG: DUF3501 family protein [Bdellovibrionota bacterium]
MRKLERSDIMDFITYQEKRAELRRDIQKVKRPRRIFLGDKLLFLFENTEMVRDHVLETINLEKLFSEHDLLRQLEVFNPLIADQGELRCTMIILNDVDWEKAKRVKLWRELASHVYIISNDGRKIYSRAPAIAVVNQHPCSFRVLSFDCGNQYPVVIGTDYEIGGYKLEAKLTMSQQKALREDLNAMNNIIAEKHDL